MSEIWPTTTHVWTDAVDEAHLELIRSAPSRFAPGGVAHLVLEVLAYCEDEADSLGRPGTVTVEFLHDGSIRVRDDGRGTDMRMDGGRLVWKPVMATRDVRFFDRSEPPVLPDGHPRRGMSTVAALSQWLVHENRRADGGWTQRYEHGIPCEPLTRLTDRDVSGTTVHFLADTAIPSSGLDHALRTYAAGFERLDIAIHTAV